MKRQLAIAVGILVTLGTAVSATLNDQEQTKQSTSLEATTVPSVGAQQSAQILALWKTHANSSGSVPLARPL